MFNYNKSVKSHHCVIDNSVHLQEFIFKILFLIILPVRNLHRDTRLLGQFTTLRNDVADHIWLVIIRGYLGLPTAGIRLSFFFISTTGVELCRLQPSVSKQLFISTGFFCHKGCSVAFSTTTQSSFIQPSVALNHLQ